MATLKKGRGALFEAGFLYCFGDMKKPQEEV
jgi:hypothetical protein